MVAIEFLFISLISPETNFNWTYKSSLETWIFSIIFLARKIPEKIQVSKENLAELKNESPEQATTEAPATEEGDVSIEDIKEEENTVSEAEEDSTNNQ